MNNYEHLFTKQRQGLNKNVLPSVVDYSINDIA